jgi:hypothetical protein
MSRPGPTFTPRQGQYLAFIASYERMYNQAPAEADLQAHFGVTPPTVHQMILTLERRGLISRVPGTARSIRLEVPENVLPPLEHPRSTRAQQRLPRRARPKRGRKRSTPPTDPAIEYIDSELMTHRLRDGRQLSARMHGWYGVYRTRVRLTRRPEGGCTCPSDPQPCKHVRALLATWEVNPESFLDLRAFLRSLEDHEKGQLIEMIGRMISIYPSALGALGVPGFGEDETDVDE